MSNINKLISDLNKVNSKADIVSSISDCHRLLILLVTFIEEKVRVFKYGRV